ncbi:hypothetical protein KUCAC02_031618 [Chaenocephalus aceratus]|nr:hypothetical protein KUCAC02_031618 [Chaenocephalus aceratus]
MGSIQSPLSSSSSLLIFLSPHFLLSSSSSPSGEPTPRKPDAGASVSAGGQHSLFSPANTLSVELTAREAGHTEVGCFLRGRMHGVCGGLTLPQREDAWSVCGGLTLPQREDACSVWRSGASSECGGLVLPQREDACVWRSGTSSEGGCMQCVEVWYFLRGRMHVVCGGLVLPQREDAWSVCGGLVLPQREACSVWRSGASSEGEALIVKEPKGVLAVGAKYPYLQRRVGGSVWPGGVG